MKTLTLLALLLTIISCDRTTCDNTNPIFANNDPSSKAYKDELLRQTKEHENEVEYWFKEYVERDGKTYLQFYLQNDSLCAVADVLVTDWNEAVAGIRRVKGMSYGGAEILGLEYRVEQDSLHTELIYEDLDYIID